MDRLKGREFEKILVARHGEYFDSGIATIGKYGVQFSFQDGEARPIASLPDFEGLAKCFKSQIVFDAKVCSQASFPLKDFKNVIGQRKGNRRRQLEHMYKRSGYGAICFFLIHWNERVLKTKTEPVETFIFPVDNEHPFWIAFESGEVKQVNRADCHDYGTPVKWDVLGRARTPRPNWLNALSGEGSQ